MKLTEKQKNCPYCHESSVHEYNPIYNDGVDVVNVYPNGSLSHEYIELDGNKVIKTTEALVIAYCPMCGRPLNEEED